MPTGFKKETMSCIQSPVTDCKKLIQHAIGYADATCIPLLDGISGTIRALPPSMWIMSVTPRVFRLTRIPVVNLTNHQVDDNDDDISVTDSTAWFLCSRKSHSWQLQSSVEANKTLFLTVQIVDQNYAQTVIYTLGTLNRGVVPVLTAPPSVLRCDILARKIAI
jgi:hypothetical protein